MKQTVRIRIESRQAGQSHVQETAGELYHKQESYYLRYTEPDSESGKTTATVKWDDKMVKVFRHGDVQSDLTFISGTRTAGYYELPQGRMEMECFTHSIERKLDGGLGTLSWSYELYANGVHAGRIRLRLVIEEEQAE